MPRRRRFDTPGLLHHVMNRGIARRTVFETRRDVRTFLALLAREVRAGRVEILAFSILTTHFHLLLRSRTGQLDRVMQRVTNCYVRYFNRSRHRDGPLFRGRYRAKPVRTRRYLRILIRYIDQNAPQARLSATGPGYRWGSAALYVRARRPKWLATGYVDGVMGEPEPEDRRRAYAEAFGRPLLEEEAEVVERRLHHAARDDDWDDLVGAAPPRVLDWMRRKARLADGTTPGLPYVGSARVLRIVRDARERRGDLRVRPWGSRRQDGWPILGVGLLRDLTGRTHAELGRRTECSPKVAAHRVQLHARLLEADPGYARVASELAAACLAGW
jgi:REP element-mobilizing transposase RayT